MSLPNTPEAPDKAENAPSLPDLQKIGDMEGVKDIMENLKKGDWGAMVGAIMTVWKEYFGTPEEKAEVKRAREAAKKEEASKTETKGDLKSLRQNVDRKDDSSKKSEKQEEKEEKEDAEVMPYKPGTKKPTISPKHIFKSQVEQIYAQSDTIFTTNNLSEHFGRNYRKFIIEKDPVSGEEPIMFLGRPITGGVNLMMLPFLKIAERNLMNQNLNYIPAEKLILGFQDRNMCMSDKDGNKVLHATIPSFHKYGLAIDLDPNSNWPKDGRGTIPDEVMVAMAEAGFNLGNMGDKTASHYLINDSMHFQMRFPPDSADGQRIINESPIGRRYWDAVRPQLDALKMTS